MSDIAILNEALAAQASSLADDPELVQDFLNESSEHLTRAEAGLLQLERDPSHKESLNSVFRGFHSIKGLAGFLGADGIHDLAHETENVLDRARSGKLHVTPAVTDVVLRASDELKRLLQRARTEPLAAIASSGTSLIDSLRNFTASRDEETVAPDAAAGPLTPVPEPDTKPAQANAIRVETSKLESLIDMVGELVIAESMIRQDPAIANSEDPILARSIAQLARIVREVQKTSLAVRMVPVGTLFRRMSRLVRDLDRKSGKRIELVTIGDDVELDRNIVEELADPLVHMIRNSADHGLETTEARLLAGKSAVGTIRLEATHEAGEIVIKITDDGRGLNAEKILARAKSIGLVADTDQPSGEALLNLIFEPGFSTAEKVSDLSGRGVGMDVVRKQIQKLRGRIEITSQPGKGCAFILRLPLTLAIIDGLVVTVGSERYILPMFSVREIVAFESANLVKVDNREAARIREKLLPVVRLASLFAGTQDHTESGVLVVVEAQSRAFCIAVDTLIGKQEVVIKPLGATFRQTPAISGGAILGDGKVGLILDVNSLLANRT